MNHSTTGQTEQQWMQQADETAALLDALLESSPVGMAFVDREFRYIRINKTLAAMNNLPVEAHIGRRAHELFPHLAPTWEPYWRKVLQTGQPVTGVELSSASMHGALNAEYVLVNYYPVQTRDGTIIGCGISVVDITARKRAEKRQQFLAEASKQLTTTLDYLTTLHTVAHLAVPDFADWCAINAPGDDGKINLLAAAFAFAEDEALVQRLWQRYTLDPQGEYGVAKVFRTRQAELYRDLAPSFLSQDADDPEHAALLDNLAVTAYMCVPLIAQNELFGALTFAYGRSKRQYSEDDLQLAMELAQRCTLAIENARLYQAAQVMAHYEQQHAIDLRLLAEAARAINSTLALEGLLQVAADHTRTILGVQYVAITLLVNQNNEETVLVRSLAESYDMQALPEKEHWLEATLDGAGHEPIGLIQAAQKVVGSFTSEDVAVLAQLSQMVSAGIANARLYQEARKAIQMRNDMFSLVSHDLRNPLSVIKGLAQHLSRRFEKGEITETQRMITSLQRIDEAAERMNHLIDDLLLMARKQDNQAVELQRQTIDLVDYLQQLLHGLQPTAKQQLHFESQIEHLHAPVDTNAIERVCMNLLTNAIKYSPPDQPITVRLALIEHQGMHWAELRVIDRGIGIPADDLPHIFQRFHRARNVGQIAGTGIGLVSARQMIEQHGGSLQVESVQHEGTTVIVRLPVDTGL
jgi:PAS domain S-box-containing protein